MNIVICQKTFPSSGVSGTPSVAVIRTLDEVCTELVGSGVVVVSPRSAFESGLPHVLKAHNSVLFQPIPAILHCLYCGDQGEAAAFEHILHDVKNGEGLCKACINDGIWPGRFIPA